MVMKKQFCFSVTEIITVITDSLQKTGTGAMIDCIRSNFNNIWFYATLLSTNPMKSISIEKKITVLIIVYYL